MRLFYIRFQKFQTVSGKLSWSHYLEILGIEDDVERGTNSQEWVKMIHLSENVRFAC